MYKGSCHCGRIAFEVDSSEKIEKVLDCNCSYCSRKGHLLWFVPRASLRVHTPEANQAVYAFNKHVIKHNFCPVCGCGTFGLAQDPKGNATAAINVRCLEGVEISTLTRIPYDGRSK